MPYPFHSLHRGHIYGATLYYTLQHSIYWIGSLVMIVNSKTVGSLIQFGDAAFPQLPAHMLNVLVSLRNLHPKQNPISYDLF